MRLGWAGLNAGNWGIGICFHACCEDACEDWGACADSRALPPKQKHRTTANTNSLVSGYRFSDTVRRSNPVAPLGAESARFTVHLPAALNHSREEVRR